eukprot:gene3845-4440_t
MSNLESLHHASINVVRVVHQDMVAVHEAFVADWVSHQYLVPLSTQSQLPSTAQPMLPEAQVFAPRCVKTVPLEPVVVATDVVTSVEHLSLIPREVFQALAAASCGAGKLPIHPRPIPTPIVDPPAPVIDPPAPVIDPPVPEDPPATVDCGYPWRCPIVKTGAFGICVEACDNCKPGEGCCSTGCGHVCKRLVCGGAGAEPSEPFKSEAIYCPVNDPDMLGLCAEMCQNCPAVEVMVMYTTTDSNPTFLPDTNYESSILTVFSNKTNAIVSLTITVPTNTTPSTVIVYDSNETFFTLDYKCLAIPTSSVSSAYPLVVSSRAKLTAYSKIHLSKIEAHLDITCTENSGCFAVSCMPVSPFVGDYLLKVTPTLNVPLCAYDADIKVVVAGNQEISLASPYNQASVPVQSTTIYPAIRKFVRYSDGPLDVGTVILTVATSINTLVPVFVLEGTGAVLPTSYLTPLGNNATGQYYVASFVVSSTPATISQVGALLKNYPSPSISYTTTSKTLPFTHLD